LRVWLTTLPTKNQHFSNSESNYASKGSIKKLYEEIEKKKNQDGSILNSYVKTQMIALNPNYLFCENDNKFITPFMAEKQKVFELGDRVVNINSFDCNYIPFGLKGTVTAVCKDFVEVMFDYDYFGGVTCNNRLPSNRGAYVSPLSLINLTK